MAAGITFLPGGFVSRTYFECHSRESGNPGRLSVASWTPAFAGVTSREVARLRPRHQAAVDDELGAGDVGGLVRQQEEAGVGDVLGRADAAERNGLGDGLLR